MKTMPEKQRIQLQNMNDNEIMDFQIRLQVECGMSDQEAADYISQAFDEET
jgi:hypothetical protein